MPRHFFKVRKARGVRGRPESLCLDDRVRAVFRKRFPVRFVETEMIRRSDAETRFPSGAGSVRLVTEMLGHGLVERVHV